MTTESSISIQDVSQDISQDLSSDIASAHDREAVEVESRPDASSPDRIPEIPSGLGAPPKIGLRVRRVLGDLQGPLRDPEHDPLLICVAGLHGNEPAGVLALERVFRALEHEASRGATPIAGRFVGLAGNLKALERHRRFLDLDLNRIWTVPHLQALRQRDGSRHGEGRYGEGQRGEARHGEGGGEEGNGAGPTGIRTDEAHEAHEARAAEDEEMLALANHLEALLAHIPDEQRHEVFVLDLHTASGPGPAFTVLDDTLPNREFALDLQAPVVLGIEEELDGTLMHYVSDLGFTAVGFEGGRHDDPAAVDRAEAAVWIALESAGVLSPEHPQVARSCDLLVEASRPFPRVVEVRYRHVITPEDRFRIAQGVSGFEQVGEGHVLGSDRNGSIAAREAGLVLMPLYQDQGDEGFFLVRPVRPLWLSVSKAVRRLHVERVLHWLPGVRRHPELPESFIVDRKVARFVAPELFHLLGFRRQGPAEDRYLVMSRRFGDR